MVSSVTTSAGVPLAAAKGKVYVITGGASGIGLSLASKLLKAGAKGLVLTSRKTGPELDAKVEKALGADAAASAGVVKNFKLEVNSWEDNVAVMEFAKKEFGQIDGVIANAGAGTPEMWDFTKLQKPDFTTFNEVYQGTSYTIWAAAPFLAANPNGGAIILSGSEAGYGNYSISYSYGAGKSALHNLVHSLSDRLSQHKIRIGGVSFGFVDTPLTEQLKAILPVKFIDIDTVTDEYASWLADERPSNTGGIIRVPNATAIPFTDYGEQYQERTLPFVMSAFAALQPGAAAPPADAK